MIIVKFFDDILSPLLSEYKIKYRYVLKICDDIRNRMLSLLSLWDDQEKRNAILFLSLEEAPYYLPKCRPLVAEFVVTTIRNSMLELAASDNCRSIKMINPLTDDQIKKITSSSILYFDKYEFADLVNELPTDYINIYENAIEKYPVAWEALLRLSSMEQQILELSADSHSFACEPITGDSKIPKIETTFCDGYSLTFDARLCDMLNKISTGEVNSFYVDCSKMLTRNFEKFLHVLDIILKSGGAFCTCNYYISSKRLEKRKRFLRAAHTESEMAEKIERTVNATPSIRETMESFQSALRQMK